jgi:ABC-2 type transport system permease protein
MRGFVHRRVVYALVKRDLRLYFSSPTGYVFVTLFIFLSATAAFWQRRFFLNNLANLDQLNHYFPFLLLLFVPALTMGVWAGERKQGTDELLLTLPASDFDVALGKYLAVIAIYSASLLLSLSHVVVLMWLGSPDAGLLVANYAGYWLAGAALVAIGMLASLTTANVTVAFVLGVVFCTVPVMVTTAASVFAGSSGTWIAPFGLTSQFQDFAGGVISLSGLVYFASLAGFFLYLNVLVLSRRHWSPQAAGPAEAGRHEIGATPAEAGATRGVRLQADLPGSARAPIALYVAVRMFAVLVSLVALGVLVARFDLRLDMTSERLHSLSPATRQLLDDLPADRPVFIQAFVTPDVPGLYVQARENLLNVLDEIDAHAAPKVQVLVTEAVPYSEAARTARERFGVVPTPVTDVDNPQGAADGIFLAVAMTSGAEEQIIPFMDRGLSPEYELTRAIRTVARTERKRIGIITTDAKLLGGTESDSRQRRPPWAIVKELAKQYDILQISPSAAITEQVAALIVAQPSTLLQPEMDNVRNAISRGVPAIVLVDPVSAVDMRLSPAAAMAARVDPYAGTAPVIRKNVGDVQKLLAMLGVTWPPARIVWDGYNPHPEMERLPPEIVFVGRSSGSAAPFNPQHAATAGLQEVMLLYSGVLSPSDPAHFRFEPLLRTGTLSGTVSYFQLLEPRPEGASLNTSLVHEPDKTRQEHVLAAHVRSQASDAKVNVIVVSDLDFISDQIFEIRAQGASNAVFDNVTFFLNSLDVLTGDRTFIGLRTRRARHRTLERLEAQTRVFTEQRTREEQQAQQDAQKALADAEAREKSRIDEIQARPDLDEQARQIMARNVQEVERRKREVFAANLRQAEQAKIQGIREQMESRVRRIHNTIRTIAVVVPPLPVFALGVVIFVRRSKRDREGAAALRRLRGVA